MSEEERIEGSKKRAKRDFVGEITMLGPPTYEVTEDIVHIIFSHCEDARDIAKARCVCKRFDQAGTNVLSIRYVCREIDHEKARKTLIVTAEVPDDSTGVRTGDESANCFNGDKSKHDAARKSSDSENAFGRAPAKESPRISEHVDVGLRGQTYGQDKRNDMKEALDQSSTVCCEVCEAHQKEQKELDYFPFRHVLEQDLTSKPCVQQLRIEIEPKLQSKTVPIEERQLHDFWLSDPLHIIKWVPSVSRTLQDLCIVDYAQQAIMKQSSILKILSHHCKRLKTIDLRNMFIDTKECQQMPELTTVILRSVKINGDALDDISSKMESLQTLALLGVFGIRTGCLSLLQLKVLCLGLLTKAGAVKLDLPSLSKLQLKMACPDDLCITAPALKFFAWSLEVRKAFAIKFVNISKVQELLYGASKFLALSRLVKGNRFLNKLFLDIPCLALDVDGMSPGVLEEVPLNILSFETLRVECPNLEILNIGLGLWYSMETNIEKVKRLKSWPAVKTLILHMIPQTLVTSVTLLNKFRIEMHETLLNLEINIDTTGPVASHEFLEAIRDDVRGLNFKWKPRTKSCDLSCFTF